jgi:transcriptional regulator with XRE-family HTH domain
MPEPNAEFMPRPRRSTPLGEIIRRQRELGEISMRQFAKHAGISNPYLSQIERGLREPSEKVLRSIARALETSVEDLYEAAGIERDEEGLESAVVRAIREDPALGARERRALITLYESLVRNR